MVAPPYTRCIRRLQWLHRETEFLKRRDGFKSSNFSSTESPPEGPCVLPEPSISQPLDERIQTFGVSPPHPSRNDLPMDIVNPCTNSHAVCMRSYQLKGCRVRFRRDVGLFWLKRRFGRLGPSTCHQTPQSFWLTQCHVASFWYLRAPSATASILPLASP